MNKIAAYIYVSSVAGIITFFLFNMGIKMVRHIIENGALPDPIFDFDRWYEKLGAIIVYLIICLLTIRLVIFAILEFIKAIDVITK